jgi:amino acid transporter
MVKIIFLFSFAFFTFCFTYFFINKLKVKINKKKPFDLKNLPENKKRIFVSFIVFLGLSLLLQNIILR